MNKNYLQLGIILLLIIGAGWYVIKERSPTTPTIRQEGTTQDITLSMKNNNYYPNTIRVKAEEPVTIKLDNSVKGCYRVFTIPTLGVNKYLKTPSETLTVTFPKPGNYKFVCTMGMGTGMIIAE
ncbi:MAG TPA: cupredoxin domain-containing protein [Candidatus Nanoarchaeia archaeon]|nr:cupredoxin domain-containing protein [Candidatus Nanoarchaeia archaeon]